MKFSLALTLAYASSAHAFAPSRPAFGPRHLSLNAKKGGNTKASGGGGFAKKADTVVDVSKPEPEPEPVVEEPVVEAVPEPVAEPEPEPEPVAEPEPEPVVEEAVAEPEPEPEPEPVVDLAEKYAAMGEEERAFAILVDLGIVQVTPDPGSPDYDASKDDEFCDEYD